MELAAILLPLLAQGPGLFADAEAVFNAVAHGEGGTAKIGNVLAALSHLTAQAAGAVVSIQPPPAPAPTPAPAAEIAQQQA